MSAIRVIYTKSGEFYYRYLHRFSTISLIIGISGLSLVTACGNSDTKSIQLRTKVSINRFYILDFPVCEVRKTSSSEDDLLGPTPIGAYLA